MSNETQDVRSVPELYIDAGLRSVPELYIDAGFIMRTNAAYKRSMEIAHKKWRWVEKRLR